MSDSPVWRVIERERPPIIRDFDEFIRYLSDHRLVLTRVREHLPGGALSDLNRRMTHPVSDATRTTPQTLYPLLHLSYHLALEGRLCRKVSAGSRTHLEITRLVRLYQGLTLEEQYMSLLETLWVDCDWEKLQARYFGLAPLFSVTPVLAYISRQRPGEKISLKTEVGKGSPLAKVLSKWGYFQLYFSFFGIWQVTLAETNGPKHLVEAESITPTEVGVAIAPVLCVARDLPRWNVPTRRKMGEWRIVPGSPLPGGQQPILEDVYNALGEEYRPRKVRIDAEIGIEEGELGEPFFKPFIPLFGEANLKKTLPREEIRHVEGAYRFKVSLDKNTWRRIMVSSEHTLDDLHHAILEAFNFQDIMHLYAFFMDGQLWSYKRFTSPDDTQGPYADKPQIGELGLHEGQKILYLFDYGDEWRFSVELEEIGKEEPKPKKPKITQRKGKAPPQYRW